MNITFTAKKGSSGDTLPSSPPYTLDIYDDATNVLVQSGIRINSSVYVFPDIYKNEIGVYRIIATDADGRTGEVTIAIRSGPVARMEFTPVSSTLAK